MCQSTLNPFVDGSNSRSLTHVRWVWATCTSARSVQRFNHKFVVLRTSTVAATSTNVIQWLSPIHISPNWHLIFTTFGGSFGLGGNLCGSTLYLIGAEFLGDFNQQQWQWMKKSTTEKMWMVRVTVQRARSLLLMSWSAPCRQAARRDDPDSRIIV